MKRNAKEIIKKIKEKQKPSDKKNYTFRFSERLMSDFEAKCEKNGISMTSVLEELLGDFVSGL